MYTNFNEKVDGVKLLNVDIQKVTGDFMLFIFKMF